MVLQKKTINNVPTLVPLTADTGSGVPVGTIIGQYKKVNMPGYLYLDGSTFDQTLYPALYAYLGTNVLPDYREFVLVGAEQNTTSSVINQTGHDHDVFTQGQEKDDQLQDHTHSTSAYMSQVDGTYNERAFRAGSITGSMAYLPMLSDYYSGRSGTTTRTKEKAVFWYIKATTGIIESEATEMLNVINENNSYSLNEIATGKTWIDGKPIYRTTISGTSYATSTPIVSNVDTFVDYGGTVSPESGYNYGMPYYNMSQNKSVVALLRQNNIRVDYTVNQIYNFSWWFEYTKTTD